MGHNNQSDIKNIYECMRAFSTTTDSSRIKCYSVSNMTETTVWTPEVIHRVVMIVCIMILTIIGNSVIIFVLTCTRYRKKQSRVNLFITNLAIGDLAVCFVTMTTEILFVAFGEWVLGNAACKILTYLQIVTLASTTFILTSMSIDRYVSLCRPLQFHQPSSALRAKRMCLASWILAFVFATPQLLIFVQTQDKVLDNGRIKYECRSQGYTAFWQRKVYFTFLTSYILVIPVIIMSYCYISVVVCVWRQGRPFKNQSEKNCHQSISSKNTISTAKVKTIKMTFAIIVTFIACWTPYFVTGLIKIYSEYQFRIPNSVIVFAETATLLQSALNPVLYGCFNIKLKHLIRDHCCRPFFHTPKTERAYNVGASGTIVVTGKINYYLRRKSNDGAASSSGSSRGINDKHEQCFKLKVRFITKASSKQENNDGSDD